MNTLDRMRMEMLMEQSRGIVVHSLFGSGEFPSSAQLMRSISHIPFICTLDIESQPLFGDRRQLTPIMVKSRGVTRGEMFMNVGTAGHIDHNISVQDILYMRHAIAYEQLFKEPIASDLPPVVVYIKPKKGEGKERGRGLGKHSGGKKR